MRTIEPTFEVRWGAATHPGRRRKSNQDAFLAQPPIFAIADGMGGHERGEVAARVAVDALRPLAGADWLTPRELYDAIRNAAETVRAAGGSGPGAPGSTLSGVGLTNQDGVPCWLVFNIGDSRVYRISEGELEQITVDHSKVQEMVEAGRLTAAEAREHRDHNIITRALGAGRRALPEADQWLLTASHGDRVLICSDGLSGELTDQFLAAALLTIPDPQGVADHLVARAVEAGGRDNATALVIDVLTVGVPAGGSFPAIDADVTEPGDIDDSTLDFPAVDVVPTLDFRPDDRARDGGPERQQ